MVDANQFKRDLLVAYKKLCKTPLQEQFLARLVDVFGEVYRYKDVSSYKLLELTCIESLIAFTNRIHSACLETPPVATLFKTTHVLSTFIGQTQSNQFIFNPGQKEAYEALAEPFKRNREALKDVLNYDHVYPGSDIDMFPDPDIDITPRQVRSAWEKRDKAVSDAYDKTDKLRIAVAGTPLFHHTHSLLPNIKIDLPFELPDDIRFRGMFVCAPPGRGKTNLLRHLIEDDRKKKGCIILMDPKGDLIDCYRAKAFVIQPSISNPPPLNPLDLGSSIQTSDLLEHIFASIFSNEMRPGQSNLFKAVISLAMLIPDATLFTVFDIFTKGPDKFDEVYQLPQRLQDLLLIRWNNRIYKERRPEIEQRLDTLLSNPYLEAMFATKKTAIDFKALMDGQNLVVVDNSYGRDMLGDMGCEFFGRYILAIILAEAYRRAGLPDHQKNPVRIYVDEAHKVIKRDATVSDILRQCRSQKIAMTFANQAISDYEEHVRSALMDCGIFMVNPGAEAPAWVGRLNLEHRGVQSLKNLPTHTFATFVETVTPAAVNIAVEWLPLPTTRRIPEPPPELKRAAPKTPGPPSNPAPPFPKVPNPKPPPPDDDGLTDIR